MNNQRTRNNIKLKARWDHDEIPAGEASVRGLLLEIDAPETALPEAQKRPPVNLAIVIDRSGSMQGGRLRAAREAAIGVAQRLRNGDRLSVVAYDNQVDLLLNGGNMNRRGRAKAEAIIDELRTGGTTDLAAGWLQGARCVADVMEAKNFESGHVILLSDGHANRGIVDPMELNTLAGDLSLRGVTSSCVGIGDGYSPLQLGAIVDGGQGELHHSSEPEEITEVLMGELGEVTRIAARNFSIELQAPAGIKIRQLTTYRETRRHHGNEILVGNLVGGQQRQVAFLVEVPEYKKSQSIKFSCNANWLDPQLEGRPATIQTEHAFRLKVVAARKFDKSQRNKPVARAIAELWLARHGYEAMMLNERGLYDEAMQVFDRDENAFIDMIAELEDAGVMLQRRRKSREHTSMEWRGMSKLEAMSGSRKSLRSKPDYRASSKDKDWSDYRPD